MIKKTEVNVQLSDLHLFEWINAFLKSVLERISSFPCSAEWFFYCWVHVSIQVTWLVAGGTWFRWNLGFEPMFSSEALKLTISCQVEWDTWLYLLWIVHFWQRTWDITKIIVRPISSFWNWRDWHPSYCRSWLFWDWAQSIFFCFV